jgi:hypothetical protein
MYYYPILSQELFENAKKNFIQTHGMTAQQFEEDAKKN